MPRQSRNTIPWFKHDCEPGRTIPIIEKIYQNDGYSLMWKLLEFLGKSENHYIDMNKSINIQFLCERAYLSQDRLLEILDKFAELDFIDAKLWEEKIIWSENFVLRLKEFYTKLKKPLPERPTIKAITNSMPNLSSTANNNNLANLNHPEIGDSIPEIGDSIPEIGDSIPEIGDSIPEIGDSIPEIGDKTGINLPPLQPPLIKNKIKNIELDIEREKEKKEKERKESSLSQNNFIFSKENIIKILNNNPKIKNGEINAITENYIANRKQWQINYKSSFFCTSKGIEIQTEEALELDLELWVNREIRDFRKNNKGKNGTVSERYDKLSYTR